MTITINASSYDAAKNILTILSNAMESHGRTFLHASARKTDDGASITMEFAE